MTFSGYMCLKITLKVRKKQVFNLSLEDKLFKKPFLGLSPPVVCQRLKKIIFCGGVILLDISM